MAHLDNVESVLQAMFSAIASLSGRQDSDVVLRPSMYGICPPRLWQLARQPALRTRDPAQEWPALQGSWNEPLMRTILRLAGATVLDPPEDDESPEALELQDRDPVMGDRPHADGLVRWHLLNRMGFGILELKFLRARAFLELLEHGLEGDRQYAFQTVCYVNETDTLMENYGRLDPMWGALAALGVRPKWALFLAVAKDPSSTKMFYGQSVKPAQYESVEGRTLKSGRVKDLTPQQVEQIQRRAERTARFELNGEQVMFYFEVVDVDDEWVQETWRELQRVPAQIEADEPPMPIHDPTLPEDQRDAECSWCEVADWCRERMFALQFEGTEQLIRERFADDPEGIEIP